MTDEEIHEAAKQVSELAVRLGLHGVMLLTPECPHCGQLHDWCIYSNVGSDTHDLLDHWREAVDADTDDPDIILTEVRYQ